MMTDIVGTERITDISGANNFLTGLNKIASAANTAAATRASAQPASARQIVPPIAA